MSKGEIVSHISEGKYRVRQKFAVERINEEISQLEERIAELAIDLPTAKLERLQANDAVEEKAREIDLAIPDLQAGVDGASSQIANLQAEMIRLQSKATMAQLRVSELIAENLSALKRRSQLRAAPEGREIEAWCADYTLDLSGEVGLVDINDEGGKGVLIQAGYASEAAFNPDRDGALFPNIAQSGPQIFFNIAVLPGVQKWLPRYRLGEITRIQADICTVLLDRAQSSAQNLDINQADTLVDIPIVYMDCDGSAFQKGDRVLVRYTASGPLVVGFESEPAPCTLLGFVFEPARYQFGPAPAYIAGKTVYGEPFEDFSGDINPPLGTEGGSRSAWTAIPNGSQLSIQSGNHRNYGNKNWINSEKLVLSWAGPPGRAHRLDQIEHSFAGFLEEWLTGPYVFSDLKIILDLSQEAQAGVFTKVFGAAISEGSEGQRWLMVVASDKEFIPVDGRDSLPGQTFKVFRAPIDAALQKTGPLEFLHEHTLPVEMIYQSHFYFSEDGSKAVCTLVGDVTDEANMEIQLLRYDLAEGFSASQIWSRNQSVGTLTVNQSYQVLRDEPVLGQVTELGDLYRSYQTQPHLTPIYCDFVGNREVIAYERHAGTDSVREANYDYLSAAEISYTASGSYRETHDSEFQVVTSDSNVLFRMPYKADKQEAISYDSLQNSQGGFFRVNNSESSQIGGIDWEENLLAIDVRFDFCAVTYGGYSYTLQESVDTTYNDPDLSSSGATLASGTISGNEIIEIVEFWMGGSMVKREEAMRLAGPIEINSYSSDPRPNLGITGSTSTSQTDINPQPPMKIGSQYLVTAAGYRSGPHSVAGVSMNYKTGPTTRKPVLLNHVSGYLDPVAGILNRTEDDRYLLCSVGLI